ncbi:3-oxo-5-alpha-steroid 4-dehydrogenase-domain-containing protein [Bisporella sp. PMI_857]|nr:3-oxo-5-alpha-steroid 4-dehydrogenase-domain-containing protein [Bisporella sp. PMI_857]
MALIQDWLPPTRENWEWAVFIFQLFPLVSSLIYLESSFNFPGKIGWITMECPGVLTVVYCLNTLPPGGYSSLPLENKVLGGLFVIHYAYRAIIGPLIAPSMAPISPLVWLFAISFQLFNGLSIGGWLGAYGPTTRLDWKANNAFGGARFGLGLIIWALGLIGNIWHDDELREIRRAAARKQKKQEDNKGEGVEKVYMIPQNGLFRWIFYPHYLLEWIEWSGFWLMAGRGCTPARNFLVNEMATMAPRALQGKKWYEGKFGKEKTEGRKALIPGIL